MECFQKQKQKQKQKKNKKKKKTEKKKKEKGKKRYYQTGPQLHPKKKKKKQMIPTIQNFVPQLKQSEIFSAL